LFARLGADLSVRSNAAGFGISEGGPTALAVEGPMAGTYFGTSSEASNKKQKTGSQDST
jgi:hypothetical protein